MNKIRKIALCLSAVAVLSCAAQQINPITRAMLNGYDEVLRQNPKDYSTLYDRAAQYYQLSRYDQALDDVTKAIEYTPAKEGVLRVQELSLMADIATEMKNYELALRAITEAVDAQPDNYANIYKKGNILLALKRPEDAYRAFSSLQRLKSRSQEAYFGMAQACIMQGKMTDAADLLKEAEAADPTNYLTFCRVGDLYQEMGQNENAASNYLIGFTMAQDPMRPLQSLINLGKKDYSGVAAAMNYAIDKSTSKVPLLYLKGTIANESGNYTDAENAFSTLLNYPDGQQAGVYYQLAKANLALNNLKNATEYIDKAVAAESIADYYVLKSQIDLANGNPATAVVDASKALDIDATSAEAMIAKANAQISNGNGNEALSTLNECVMSYPDNMEALLLRAYVNESMLKNGKGAVADLNRLVAEPAESFPALTFKGIAQAKTGKKLDGDSAVEKALKGEPTAEDYYYAAVYYAQTDNLEKGIELLKRAVFEGFQNKYLAESANTPWFSVAPLRHLLK